jgi:hypothetical protein
VRPRRLRLSALVALLAALALLSGCGGSSNSDSTSPQHYLLTTADIQQMAAKTANPAAVTSALNFWRAVQFQDYGEAYNLLAKPLRSHISYDTFLSKLGAARYAFLAHPEVYDLDQSGPITVFIAAPRGNILTGDDQIIGFTMIREDGQWRIGSDPFNVFHEQTVH